MSFCLYGSAIVLLLLPCLLAGLPLNKTSDNTPNKKAAMLYSRHTWKHVRIIGSKIDAKGDERDQYAQLILESFNIHGHIWIKSAKENTFLCVDETGVKLVVESTSSKRCEFVEGYRNGFTVFQSLFKRSWYIGFKKNGQVKKPQRTSSQQKATWFLLR